MTVDQLMPGVYRFVDTCNVYALDDGRSTIVIDYGSGAARVIRVHSRCAPDAFHAG